MFLIEREREREGHVSACGDVARKSGDFLSPIRMYACVSSDGLDGKIYIPCSEQKRNYRAAQPSRGGLPSPVLVFLRYRFEHAGNGLPQFGSDLLACEFAVYSYRERSATWSQVPGRIALCRIHLCGTHSYFQNNSEQKRKR